MYGHLTTPARVTPRPVLDARARAIAAAARDSADKRRLRTLDALASRTGEPLSLRLAFARDADALRYALTRRGALPDLAALAGAQTRRAAANA